MGSAHSMCGACSTRDCKAFENFREHVHEPLEWSCRPGSRFDLGFNTKSIVMPKLVLLSNPGYQDYDGLSSMVDKTMVCNPDYRRCYLEGYFEVLTTFNADLNEYVSTNWWAITRVYLTRAAKMLGQVILRVVAPLLIGAPIASRLIGFP
ncbi:hypothetical protein BGZ65_012026 [Modicella reniformis]|uniref:Uncharacterized protein n=1 Tax=Modicella reniformis TaxID=1440133 RepID=A0A9P6LTP9_9FUNG|nr:hypothetical protein BGZ65_012026 [Modicella reniformis]